MYTTPSVVPSISLPASIHVQPLEIRAINIRSIFLEAFAECTMTPAGNRYNSTVWNKVFCKVFNRTPCGDQDPLWDTLFARNNFRALAEVLTL